MNDNKLEKLDHRIAVLRKRLEAAERMREAVKDDPELLDLLDDAASLASATNGNGPPIVKGRRRGSGRGAVYGGATAQGYFRSIADFLESKGNEAYAISEIAKAVNLKPSNVIQICYRTHRVLFEQQGVPGHKTRKKWRLKKNWRDLFAADKEI